MFEGHPYLTEIKSNVYHIPERLKEIDPTFFVAWNNKKQRIEIHCSENKGNTLYMVVPFNELDSRIIDHVKQNMKLRDYGLLKVIEENNRRLEQEAEKERKNWIKDVVNETRWHFQKDKETLGL